MKLTKLHLFLIVLSVLVASTLGFSIKEYFDAKVPTNKVDSKGDRINKAMKKGDRYNPFQNNEDSILDVLSKKGKKKRRKRKGSYDCLIAELEDNVNPHRRERRKKYDAEFEDDDRWVLKSEIVPPVCPKCPDSRTCPRAKPCPPCKPCGRCPEPAFTCKKVPNYNAMNASSLGGSGASGGSGGANGSRGSSQGDGSYDSSGNVSGGSQGGSLPMARLNSFSQFN